MAMVSIVNVLTLDLDHCTVFVRLYLISASLSWVQSFGEAVWAPFPKSSRSSSLVLIF